MPRTIPIALAEDMAGSCGTLCGLIKITPVQPGFSAYGVTTLDRDVVYDDGSGEITYLAAIGSELTTLTSSADLSVAGGETRALMPVFDTPVSEADLASGAYDFAEFTVYVIDYQKPEPGRHYIAQTGTLGRNTITDNGLSFTTELRGLADSLKQSITEKWSLICRATFGSQPIGTGGGVVEERFPCKYDVSTLWEPGIVEAVGVENTRTLGTSGLSPLFGGAPGVIKFTSGKNAGRTYEVERFTDEAGEITIDLMFPTMFPIEIGDTFDFRDDCPGTKEACKARGNWANFRGEPNIPVGDEGQIATPGASLGVGSGGVATPSTEVA